LTKTRTQTGSLCAAKNGSGNPIWIFRWWETRADGTKVRRKKQVGPLAQYPSAEDAEKAIRNWRIAVAANQPHAFNGFTMGDLIAHFRATELLDIGEDGRAWSTRDRYSSTLNCWVEPRWGHEDLSAIKAPQVEKWLRDLKQKPRRRKDDRMASDVNDLKPLARGTKAKIRNLMSVLFNHAIRWQFVDRNPISGPQRGSGVRQGSKRMQIPDILGISEMQDIVSNLQIRERTLLFLDVATGLRRGELAGLKWKDIDFKKMLIYVERSVVNQVVGPCKTETSKKPVPLDEHTAQDLLKWYRITPYREPEDWIFASNSNRAGKKRGKQPLWLSTIMRYHIQPVVRKLNIQKRVTWHTFRRTFTSLLTSNREDIKVVQELLRHGSSRVTMDIYAQANMLDKRKAQLKVIDEIRPPGSKTE